MEIQFSIEQIQDIAQRILSNYPNQRCFAFYAEMGSGKTTLIRALCTLLGAIDNVSSPTYSIINEYKTSQEQTIVHMDWYRLKHVEDAIEAGVQDILAIQNNYCFVEWPEIAPELLPKRHVEIRIELVSANERILRSCEV